MLGIVSGSQLETVPSCQELHNIIRDLIFTKRFLTLRFELTELLSRGSMLIMRHYVSTHM